MVFLSVVSRRGPRSSLWAHREPCLSSREPRHAVPGSLNRREGSYRHPKPPSARHRSTTMCGKTPKSEPRDAGLTRQTRAKGAHREQATRRRWHGWHFGHTRDGAAGRWHVGSRAAREPSRAILLARADRRARMRTPPPASKATQLSPRKPSLFPAGLPRNRRPDRLSRQAPEPSIPRRTPCPRPRAAPAGAIAGSSAPDSTGSRQKGTRHAPAGLSTSPAA